MKFSELDLYQSVAEVYADLQAEGKRVRSDEWLLDGATELTQRIVLAMTKSSEPELLRTFLTYAKAPRNGADVPKLHLTIEVARQRGHKCFYAMLGNCSEDVHLDRILPGSRGGQYTLANCVLSCGRHNTMRGDQPISEFLNPVAANDTQ